MLLLASCATEAEPEQAEQPEQTQEVAVYDQGEGDHLQFEYPKEWTRAGGDIDFANVQELDSLLLLTFTSAPKLGESMGSSQLSGVETFDQFRTSFLNDPYEASMHEDWNSLLSIEVIEYSAAGENGIYTLPEGEGTVALWQYGKKNYALVDAGSKHQEDGSFETLLKNIREAE